MAEPPLVIGPHALCSMELVALLLAGHAGAPVKAFTDLGVKAGPWPAGPGVPGMLSNAELESGVPLNDGLKSPKSPVWLLHGGDRKKLSSAGPTQSMDANAR